MTLQMNGCACMQEGRVTDANKTSTSILVMRNQPSHSIRLRVLSSKPFAREMRKRSECFNIHFLRFKRPVQLILRCTCCTSLLEDAAKNTETRSRTRTRTANKRSTNTNINTSSNSDININNNNGDDDNLHIIKSTRHQQHQQQ